MLERWVGRRSQRRPVVAFLRAFGLSKEARNLGLNEVSQFLTKGNELIVLSKSP